MKSGGIGAGFRLMIAHITEELRRGGPNRLVITKPSAHKQIWLPLVSGEAKERVDERRRFLPMQGVPGVLEQLQAALGKLTRQPRLLRG
jgi:hypothetical protein